MNYCCFIIVIFVNSVKYIRKFRELFSVNCDEHREQRRSQKDEGWPQKFVSTLGQLHRFDHDKLLCAFSLTNFNAKVKTVGHFLFWHYS